VCATEAAWRGRDEEEEAIGASLEIFLLANAETPELEWDSCAMLSAMSFEQLMGRGRSSAVSLAQDFARLWSRFSGIALGAPSALGGTIAEWMPEQRAWSIHRKWMKELAKRGPRERTAVRAGTCCRIWQRGSTSSLPLSSIRWPSSSSWPVPTVMSRQR
jgi:hypothetical protein